MRKYKQIAENDYNSSHSIPLNLMADNKEIMKTLVATAISNAIDECIQEDILIDFFTEYRKEIIEVGKHEYSYERHMQIVQDEGIIKGIDLINALNSKLAELGRTDDIIRASSDPQYQRDLIRQLIDENYK